MKAWSTWFPDLLPHVPGCPQPIAEHELRRAAQAFFRKTFAWKVTQAASAVVAGDAEHSATPVDTSTELARVESAWYDGKQLDPMTPEALEAQYNDEWMAHTGTPTHYLQLSFGTVRLYPVPLADAATGLKLRLAVVPSESSAGLPDELADHYRDEIQVGAKSRLMLYPNKSWTNMDLAGVYASSFGALADSARAEAARAQSQARIPSRTHWC